MGAIGTIFFAVLFLAVCAHGWIVISPSNVSAVLPSGRDNAIQPISGLLAISQFGRWHKAELLLQLCAGQHCPHGGFDPALLIPKLRLGCGVVGIQPPLHRAPRPARCPRLPC